MPIEQRLRRTLKRLLGALALCSAAAAPAQTIESVLAPGPVIQGHVKVEHDCKACHSRFDRAAQDALCVACHKEVGADVRAGTGWHGRRPAKAQCRSCHGEHKGRDALLATFDKKTFDHRQTDFELRDKHSALDCAKCHPSGKRWAEAPVDCAGCHTKDDVHKGGLGRRCGDCHDARDWKHTGFNHSTKTRFELLDKHLAVKCDGCHAEGRFKDTPRECIGCHRRDDRHKGQYGEKCEGCHGAKAWKPSSFNHNSDTRYALQGAHRQTKCAACHTGALYGARLGKDCVSCHAKDDKHQETLGRQCADCHGERSWKEPPGFDHAKSRFALLGAHQRTACKDCHSDALYRRTPGRCVDCHRKTDRHEGNLGERCEACHAEERWKDVRGRFDHDRTRMPLRNAHAAATVRCADCHETLVAMRGQARDCLSCHRRDDRHEGTAGTQCRNCHGDTRWKVERFDHNRTRYGLLGRHAVAPCASCHRSLRFTDAARECLACHRADDTHKGTLGVRCESCHNERSWALWSYDHKSATRFALNGAHARLRCLACHIAPAPAGRAAAALASECVACHRKADVHDGRFGRRCEQCHDTDHWRQLRPSNLRR